MNWYVFEFMDNSEGEVDKMDILRSTVNQSKLFQHILTELCFESKDMLKIRPHMCF